VTRDRLYIDAMQQVYSNVSKVMVDSRNNSNLLYLPLDKLLQHAGASVPAGAAVAPPAPTLGTDSTAGSAGDARSRDNARGRDRESR
jgi:membrane protease subunit HflK